MSDLARRLTQISDSGIPRFVSGGNDLVERKLIPCGDLLDGRVQEVIVLKGLSERNTSLTYNWPREIPFQLSTKYYGKALIIASGRRIKIADISLPGDFGIIDTDKLELHAIYDREHDFTHYFFLPDRNLLNKD